MPDDTFDEHDDHADLSSLDFSYDDGSSSEEDNNESADLDFLTADADTEPEPVIEPFDEYIPAEPESESNELDAIQSSAEPAEEPEDSDESTLFTVTNPTGTVSISANMDGSIQQIELTPHSAGMGEKALADEILVIADLARQKGLAGQHAFLIEQTALLEDIDPDSPSTNGLRDFFNMPNGLNLTSPEQAIEAQATVFAARYRAGN